MAITKVDDVDIEYEELGDGPPVAYFLANNPAYRLFAGDTAENRQRVHDMIATTNPVGFANTLRAMLKPDSTPQDLERIVAPTLVMAGEFDPAMAAIRATYERIPAARLMLVPGAGICPISTPQMLSCRRCKTSPARWHERRRLLTTTRTSQQCGTSAHCRAAARRRFDMTESEHAKNVRQRRSEGAGMQRMAKDLGIGVSVVQRVLREESAPA